jgi:hypothetical protein
MKTLRVGFHPNPRIEAPTSGEVGVDRFDLTGQRDVERLEPDGIALPALRTPWFVSSNTIARPLLPPLGDVAMLERPSGDARGKRRVRAGRPVEEDVEATEFPTREIDPPKAPGSFTLLDHIEHLDFDVPCACCARNCLNHDEDECVSSAAVFAIQHQIDICDNPDCNVMGDVVSPMCQPCLQCGVAAAQQFVRQANRFGRRTCKSCGTPLSQWRDVIRAVHQLNWKRA